MANRAFSHFRRFCNWCVEQGHIDTNPCNGLKAPGVDRERERVLDDAELVEVWQSCELASGNWPQIFKLLILTAQRKSEVVGMEWDEINFEEKLWKIPGRRTKNGRAHEVPLTKDALLIIKNIPRLEGSIYVFSSTGKSPTTGQSRIKLMIDKRIKAVRSERSDGAVTNMPRWTIHDLRRTATTGMARLAASLLSTIAMRIWTNADWRYRLGKIT